MWRKDDINNKYVQTRPYGNKIVEFEFYTFLLESRCQIQK